jgi:hypothetical protein
LRAQSAGHSQHGAPAARKIPFILHSGYGHAGEACHSGIVIPKPANPAALVDALVKALEA